MSDFVHLHLHTTYSLLDGQCQIKPLVAKAKSLGMTALAVTDHGMGHIPCNHLDQVTADIHGQNFTAQRTELTGNLRAKQA